MGGGRSEKGRSGKVSSLTNLHPLFAASRASVKSWQPHLPPIPGCIPSLQKLKLIMFMAETKHDHPCFFAFKNLETVPVFNLCDILQRNWLNEVNLT